MVRKLRVVVAGSLLGALAAYSGAAGAAGFAIIEHSAQGMGNAFAGGGAAAEDASTVWFNPASISRLPSQVQAAGHVILPQFEFSDRGSVQNLTPFQGGGAVPLLPGAPAVNDGGKLALVPNMYYIRKFTDRLSFGLGINAPFGLATEYDRNWRGRYQAVESEILTFNINPAIAYKANDMVTVGFGVSGQYIDAKLSQAIDFTQSCAAGVAVSTTIPTALKPLATAGCVGTPGSGANDGFGEVKGDDISFGWNTGILLEFNENARLSFAYRSEIKHKLDGKATFQVPSGPLNTAPTVPTPFGLVPLGALVDANIRSSFQNTGITVGATLPDSFSISGYFRFHPKFAIMGDATWTDWADVPQLLIVFDNPATTGDGITIEPLEWTDVWRLSAGLAYYHNDRLTLRTGVAYDEAPVPSAQLRTARLPDNDRVWVSVGASYRYSDKLSFDAGYTHLFINDTPIRRTSETGNLLIGSYESDADIISVQMSYRFD